MFREKKENLTNFHFTHPLNYNDSFPSQNLYFLMTYHAGYYISIDYTVYNVDILFRF